MPILQDIWNDYTLHRPEWIVELRTNCVINRRNICKDPSNDVNAILTVVEGHILSAVIQVLDMTSLDDEP